MWGGSLHGWAPWLTARCHLYLWAPPAVGGGGACRLCHHRGCLFRGVTFWQSEKLFAAALNLRHPRQCVPGPASRHRLPPARPLPPQHLPAGPSPLPPFWVSEPQAWTPSPGSIFPGATLPHLLLQLLLLQRSLDQRVTPGPRTLGALTPGVLDNGPAVNGSFLALGPSVFRDRCHVPISLHSLPGSVLDASSGHGASLPASRMGCHLEQPEPGAQGAKVAESPASPLASTLDRQTEPASLLARPCAPGLHFHLRFPPSPATLTHGVASVADVGSPRERSESPFRQGLVPSRFCLVPAARPKATHFMFKSLPVLACKWGPES